jgi:hypothetical protein
MALARALEDALPTRGDENDEDDDGTRRRTRRRVAKRVAEGVREDDARRETEGDAWKGDADVVDVLVDARGDAHAGRAAIERATALETALTCNYAPMVREYLASRGTGDAWEDGPPPFEEEDARARAVTREDADEDAWVYDVYEMMDADASDGDDDADGARVIRLRDFYDDGGGEEAESDYGDSDSNAEDYFDDYPDTESDSSEYSDRFDDDAYGTRDEDVEF